MSPAEALPRPVLVVEDNLANQALTRAVLERSGYRVEIAGSAEQARVALEHLAPLMILMDVRLPGEDGLSLVRLLRADPRTAAIPIVALSAHAMRSDQERALDAGCDGYITKPINTRTFVAEIERVINASSVSPR